jgi:pimeloyl-ACP methyl ester carboxylesterase
MPTAQVNGIEVYYEQAGEGPPVLLLHGLGSSTRDWEYQAPELTRAYRVITMDVRGHGRSSRPPGPYSVAQFSEDAVALLRALDAAPAHIIGLSMGGMVAFQMAVDHPEAVRSLAIINSGPAMILRGMQKAALTMRFAVVKLFGMKTMAGMIARKVLPLPSQGDLRQTLIQRFSENDPRAYLDSVRAINGWSVEERIGKIGCPVLIVASDQDYTSVAWKHAYAARIPGARVVVVKDSRHIAPVDQPEQLNQMLMQFLATASRQP